MRKRRVARAPSGAACTRPLRLMRELRGRKNCAIDAPLISPRLRRNRLDIARQGLKVHRPIVEARLAVRIEPYERVFEPARIVAVRKILARMRAAAFGAMRGRKNRGSRLQQEILKLEGFDEV